MARAALLSLLLHVLPLGLLFLVAWLAAEPEEQRFVIEAPLGQVFVGEPAGAEKPAINKKNSEAVFSAEAGGMALPENTESLAVAGGPNGLPTGEAVPIGKIEPTYPAASRRLGEEGESVWQLAIGADGSVISAELEKSSGHARLDEAAREALRNARFQPTASGAAPSSKRFRIEFRLSGNR